MPQQNYALDVAYQSDIAVMDETKPISMAYGFVLLTGVSAPGNKGLGEKVDQSIDAGDTVIFSVFDTASSLAQVTSIVITSYDVANPNVPADPFGWSTPGIYTLNNPAFGGSGGQSAGCNMKGYGLSTPTFTAQSKVQGKGQTKTYDFTITVTLQNGRVFSVDPEMDVEAGG